MIDLLLKRIVKTCDQSTSEGRCHNEISSALDCCMDWTPGYGNNQS